MWFKLIWHSELSKMEGYKSMLVERLNQGLGSIPNAEKIVIRFISTFCTLLSVVAVIRELVSLPGAEESLWGIYIDYTYIGTKGRIALILAINSIVVYPFRAKRFLISLVMLIWVAIEYSLWFAKSMSFLQRLDQVERETLTKPVTLGFYQAGWLDMIILAITLFLLTWTVKTLVSIFRSSPDRASGAIVDKSQLS